MTTADGHVIGLTQIGGTAELRRAFNILMLAEGFTDAEQTVFDQACGEVRDAFLGTPPYDQVADGLNFFRLNVMSLDSGADDPSAGIRVRTYFDATFGVNGVQRLLGCNQSTALRTAAGRLPQYTTALVVVNSSQYGGSGGDAPTFSLHQSAKEIALHEMGHSRFALADEYSYYLDENESGHDHHPRHEPNAPNVTIAANRGRLKWSGLVAADTPIPTKTNPDCRFVDNSATDLPPGIVGLFEGAGYYHCGAYRPEFDCKMRHLGVPFCRVCADAILQRLRRRIGGVNV